MSNSSDSENLKNFRWKISVRNLILGFEQLGDEKCSTKMGGEHSREKRERLNSVKDRINLFNSENTHSTKKLPGKREISLTKNSKLHNNIYIQTDRKLTDKNNHICVGSKLNNDKRELNNVSKKTASNRNLEKSNVSYDSASKSEKEEWNSETINNKINDKTTLDNTEIDDNASLKTLTNYTGNETQFSEVLNNIEVSSTFVNNKMSSSNREVNLNSRPTSLELLKINLQEHELEVAEKFKRSQSEHDLDNLHVLKQESVDELGKNVFGQRSFETLENIDFVEAYNRVGDELIITSVAVVERKLIYQNTDLDRDVRGDELLSKDITFHNGFHETLMEELILSDNYEINNKLYFPESEIKKNEVIKGENRRKSEADSAEIREVSSTSYDRTIKTETVYDVFQNPRIAKVSNVNSLEPFRSHESLRNATESEPKSPQTKRHRKDYIIEELINTEKLYIKHLKKVIVNYMPMFSEDKIHPLLADKSQNLFGNIRKIYAQTKKFYNCLLLCNFDHEEIAKTFLASEKLFELYPFYYKNKPLADLYLINDLKEIVKECENRLNDRLGLASYLLTPLQRMGKYKLFLEQIQKELNKTGETSENISEAIKLVHKQMSKGNDYIAIDSIKECPLNLLVEGSFIMREKFYISKPKKYEAMLFLFEEILVFTTIDPKNQELFIYKDSIKLNEMGIVTFDDRSLIFHLKRFLSYKKGPTEHQEYIVEARTNKIKKAWTTVIEKRLWNQLMKCKKEQSNLKEHTEVPFRGRREGTEYKSLPSEVRKRNSKSMFYLSIENNSTT